MKKSKLPLLAAFAALATLLPAQAPLPGNPAKHGVPGTNTGPAAAGNGAKPAEKLTSTVGVWENLKVESTKTGARRAVLDGPTTTLDKLHVHISTLNPGEKSGEPRLHLQEEIIIVKEGTLEATSDGVTRTATAGSVIFFAAHSVTFMRNIGSTPATYTVIYYYSPLTPKS